MGKLQVEGESSKLGLFYLGKLRPKVGEKTLYKFISGQYKDHARRIK